MDIIGTILEILKCVVPPVWKYVQYHRNLEKNMEKLQRKLQELNSQKEEIEETLKAQCVLGKKPNNEVNTWLQNVQKINSEVQDIEKKVNKGRYCSRARLGKLAAQKIAGVIECHQKGCSFSSLVIDVPLPSGLELPTTILAGKRNKEILEQIWKYLMIDKVKKIGVYGMGGIGKTTIMKHINNDLLKETGKFNYVIWVTVSQTLDLIKLQNEIAIALNQSFPPTEDKVKRAGMLSRMLTEKGKFLLILDDLWEAFPLHEVGIPEPTEDNGCKLVITTRSTEVCRSMGCDLVKVQPLSEQEALNLFLDKVGRSILQDTTLKEIVSSVVEQCAGLPLAIVTIAGCMKDEKEIHQWKNALNELCGHVRSVQGADDEIFGRLEFSYNRLKDKNVQHCFLYCALYPEDYKISKDELIDYWITEGFLDDMDNVQTKCDRGYAILDRLVNNCLLESADNGSSVKMHDVIRDMALRITSRSPLFMVKAGINLRKFPREQEWKENLEKVSLIMSFISEIPSNISPKCQTLSTLLLKESSNLQRIPECFFVHMLGLKILDLSYTNIEDLPNSVSDLINLKSLLLRRCGIHRVPSLAKLLALQHLDLLGTRIHEVPEGLEMLENLHYLNLFSSHPVKLAAGIFPKLHCLFKLILHVGSETSGETVEEVAKLSNQLGVFHGHFSSLKDFNIYANSLGIGGPRSYCLGHGLRRRIFSTTNVRNVLDLLQFEPPRPWILGNDRFSTVDSLYESHIKEEKLVKLVRLCECRIPREDSIELPKNVQHLSMSEIDGLRSLNDVFSRDQRGIYCTYSSLKAIFIRQCHCIMKLLSPQLLSVLQNLETIRVLKCNKLEEIIAFSVDDDEKDGNRKKELGKDPIPTVTLPKLKQLELYYLPALKNICSNSGVIVCNSLQEIIINGCPKLERLSLSLPVGDNGEPSRITTLKTIEIRRETWDSLEWDQPNVKNVLNHFCKFVRW